jgi:hypothetical protein
MTKLKRFEAKLITDNNSYLSNDPSLNTCDGLTDQKKISIATFQAEC